MHDPVYFAESGLGITPHKGQARWLRRSNRRENLLVTGNRWGKSFVSALKILHRALFRLRPLRFDSSPVYRIAAASITQDQAEIVFGTVVRLIRETPWLNELVKSFRVSPYPRMEFGNGAVVEARSTQNRGEYLLGQDYDLFIFDEVAFETDPEYVVEEVITMRLADREGELDLVSTPNGKNWFYRRAGQIRNGKRAGYFQSGDSRENQHISQRFVSERLVQFSQQRIQQNIMGQFVDAGGEILPGDYVDRALEASNHWPRLPTGEAVYISGWDLARKQTATVGITIAAWKGKARIVHLVRMKRFDWSVVIEKIKQTQEAFPGRLVVDATGLGDVVVEQLVEYNPEPVIFSTAGKAALLSNVELFHAQNRIAYERYELPDGPGKVWSLEDELREARWDDNNRCDSLMALALALWPLRRRRSPTIGPRIGKV